MKLSHDDKKAIVTRAGRGESQARIAADFKVSQQRVASIVQAANRQSARRRAVAVAASLAAGPANTVIEGDSLVLLKDLDEKFDLLIADPPYNVLDVPWDKIGDRKAYLAFMKRWISLATSRLRAKHHAFVFCSPQYVADVDVLLRDDLGITVQSRIVWRHKNLSMGRVVGRGLVNSWDAVLHFGTYELHLPEQWGSERFDVQEFAVPQTNFVDAKVHQAVA